MADSRTDPLTHRGANADGVAVSGADGSGAMFDAIAGRYDRLNRILSLGLDGGWRRRAVRSLELPGDARVLDVATGTADLALTVHQLHPDARVVGVDPSEGMLGVGRRKVAAAGREEAIELARASAEDLPFEDGSFDGVAIAFGIRNVADRSAGLRELARVTRTGGRVAILELSEPRGLLGLGARFYLRRVVPVVGSLLSGASEYRYLERSIAAFPPPERFADTVASCGLRMVESSPLTLGVCHLYVATPDREQAP